MISSLSCGRPGHPPVCEVLCQWCDRVVAPDAQHRHPQLVSALLAGRQQTRLPDASRARDHDQAAFAAPRPPATRL
jgi:hypothetical protein